MHPSALLNARRFFRTYADQKHASLVLDVGSQDINGSVKDVMPPHLKYIGVDFVKGKNVDVVIDDPYQLPFESESADIVMSSSCFEHSEMFWLLFLEILRVLRPDGLFYLNVPSNGMVHRYPVDCWRFYPDSGRALVAWGKRSGLDPLLLESFISNKFAGPWNDYVAVFLKDSNHQAKHPARMIASESNYSNGQLAGTDAVLTESPQSPDQRGLLDRIKREYWRRRERKVMASLKSRL